MLERKEGTSGSKSPARVLITRPGRGEYPIEVSMDLPFCMAATLEPPVPK